MKIHFLAIPLICLALLLAPAPVSVQSHFYFSSQDVRLPITPPEAFQAAFGDNPDVPRTDAEVLALARRLYPSREVMKEYRGEPAPPAPRPICGEPMLGLLFAALQNPAIADATRAEVDLIISAAKPKFTKQLNTKHFCFVYTDKDPDPNQCVTKAQVQATANALEAHWQIYATSFTKPMVLRGEKKIRVEIYNILGENGQPVPGRTNSNLKQIELNSSYTVRDPCRRINVSAHELFHRVQYSYGFVSGTDLMNWASEGTASWAVKFACCQAYHLWRYIGYMNEGLLSPNEDLTADRSYNACHLWVYLEEQANSYLALKEFWSGYKTSRNALNALSAVVKNRLNLEFDSFIRHWQKANFLKDEAGALPSDTYQENGVAHEDSCGVQWIMVGAPRFAGPELHSDTKIDYPPHSVAPYGAQYWEFTLDPKMTEVNVSINGEATGDYFFTFVFFKENEYSTSSYTNTTSCFMRKDLTQDPCTKLGVLVGGLVQGGSYTLSIVPTYPTYHYRVTFAGTMNNCVNGGCGLCEHNKTVTGSCAAEFPDYYIDTRFGAWVSSDSYVNAYSYTRGYTDTPSWTWTCKALPSPLNKLWLKLNWNGSEWEGELEFALGVDEEIDPDGTFITSGCASGIIGSFTIPADKIGTSFTQGVILIERGFEYCLPIGSNPVNVGSGTLTFTLPSGPGAPAASAPPSR